MDYAVTLKQLREAGACVPGYNKLVRAISGKEFDAGRETYIHFPHGEPIPLAFIAESNGVEDAIWCLRAVPGCDRDARLFAVWCARQVQHLTMDERSIAALDVSERFANGEASDEERDAARDAARAAAGDAARATTWTVARAAAWDAARATTWTVARDAVWDAARAATRAAAWDAAARAAAGDAAAGDAAAGVAAAGVAARDAVWGSQKEMFIKMCNGTAPWQLKED